MKVEQEWDPIYKEARIRIIVDFSLKTMEARRPGEILQILMGGKTTIT